MARSLDFRALQQVRRSRKLLRKYDRSVGGAMAAYELRNAISRVEKAMARDPGDELLQAFLALRKFN